MTAAYYNEYDPFAAAWLRNLIAEKLIASGEVDERSIEDVCPDDLRSFQQCHFFAGIGVWSLAARLAGIPDDAPLWSGSCPCQPFSQAGKGEGFDDQRHLWPAFHYLIEQCRPPVAVGEQVAGADGDAWFDLVSADLDATGYAFGVAETCAAGFGAPHIRTRNYWLAHRISPRLEGFAGHGRDGRQPGWVRADAIGPAAARGHADRLDDTDQQRWEGQRLQHIERAGDPQAAGTGETDRLGHPADESWSALARLRRGAGAEPAGGRGAGGLADDDSERREAGRGHESIRSAPLAVSDRRGEHDGLADPDQRGGARGREAAGREAGAGTGDARDGAPDRLADDIDHGQREHGERVGGTARTGEGELSGGAQRFRHDPADGGAAGGFGHNGGPGPVNGFWAAADWLRCRDEKWRAVEPGTFPLVDAGTFRNRVGLLRGAGNAVTIGQAEGFLRAVQAVMP